MIFYKPSYRRQRFLCLLVASSLAISLLGLVALLQLMAPCDDKGDIDSETHPLDDSGGDTDFSAVADAVAERGYREQPCKLQNSCYVMCQKTHDYLLSSSISQLLENKEECASSIRLEVSNVAFANNVLAPGWLDVTAKLSSLTLNDCQIDAFHDDAFSTSQFANLTELNLRHLTLRKLQRAALRPLHKVTTLSLDNCPYLQEVDPEVTAVLHKLKILQVQASINRSNRRVLSAFAGNISTDAIVDLRFNTLGTLRSEDLGAAAVHATSLYLSSSGIEDVMAGTFPPSVNREQLTLDDNKLTTLRNMSISFENRRSNFVIHLKNNPWNCDCSLLWLLPYVSTFGDTPQCKTPQHFANWSLVSALEVLNESCAVSITTVTSSADSETTASSTAEPTGTSKTPTTETVPNTIGESTVPDNAPDLPITSPESSTPFNTSEDPSTTHGGADSTVTTEKIPTSMPPHERPGDLKLCYHVDIQEQDGADSWSKDSVHIHDVDEFTLKISVPYDAAGGFLVWMGTDSPDCYEASPLTSPTVVLENLKPEVDYDICVLRPEETRTSIHNCHPHRTMAEYSKLPWISNGDRTFVVSMTSLGALVLTVLSAGGAALVVRRYPTLIFSDVWEVGKTTVIDRKRTRVTRRVSLPSWWPPPPPPPPRRQSSNQSTGSGSYISVPPPAPPSPVQMLAEFLGWSRESVRRKFRRREDVDRQSSSQPSTEPSDSESRQSTSLSNYSINTDSTSIFPSEDPTHTEDIYAGRL